MMDEGQPVNLLDLEETADMTNQGTPASKHQIIHRREISETGSVRTESDNMEEVVQNLDQMGAVETPRVK